MDAGTAHRVAVLSGACRDGRIGREANVLLFDELKIPRGPPRRTSLLSSGEGESGWGRDRAVSAGSTSGRTVPGSPLPNALAGALIGRVGNGAPFGIGNQASVSMPDNGVLFLGINDNTLTDNTGNFSVVISR